VIQINGFLLYPNLLTFQGSTVTLDIRYTEREAMVGPNGIGDDLARMAKALQAQHLRQGLHAHIRTSLIINQQVGNAPERNRPFRRSMRRG
jgi:hypothetical protein